MAASKKSRLNKPQYQQEWRKQYPTKVKVVCGGTKESGKEPYHKQYYIQHRDEICAKVKAYRELNSEIIKKRRKQRNKEKWAKDPVNKVNFLISKAKSRAKKKSLDFSITIEDIYIPTHCPLLEIEICYCNDGLKENSPSLDRIDPTMGYVPGNVWVVSHRANTMKSDATAEQVFMLAKNLKRRLAAK